MTSTPRTKAYKERHRLAGLCRDCSRPAWGYRGTCEACTTRERIRDGRRIGARRENWQNEGRCIICGRPLDAESDAGLKSCVACRHNKG